MPSSIGKRRVYYPVLCYHGCVQTRAQVNTYWEHIDDFISQVLQLQNNGYTFVLPSVYLAWYNGTYDPPTPIACIHIDDGLATLTLIADFLQSKGIPYGLALITSRLRKRTPEDGFCAWKLIAAYVASGYAEIMCHTHNMHSLAITQDDDGTVLSSPILEKPCYIDTGLILHRGVGDTRYAWDYSYTNDCWGLPLLGCDPYDNFATKVATTITFDSASSFSLAVIRFMTTLTVPIGNGYAAQVAIVLNGNACGTVTVRPKNYGTRTQWPEREFIHLTLPTPRTVNIGTNTLTFTTLNQGNFLLRAYFVPDASSPHTALTNSRSLQAGVISPSTCDRPAAYNWVGRPIMILGNGTGTNESDAAYTAYVSADIAQFHDDVQQWMKATWAYTDNIPVLAFSPALFGSNAAGAVVGPITLRMPLAVNTVVDCVRFGMFYAVGGRYSCIIRLEASSDDQATWTKIYEGSAIWAEKEFAEYECIAPYLHPVGAVNGWLFVKVTTLTPSPFGLDLYHRVYAGLPAAGETVYWGVGTATHNAAAVPVQMVYPFGSSYDQGGGTIDLTNVQNITPALETALSSESLTSGYSIVPKRATRAAELREPDLRHTNWTLGREIIYGTAQPKATLQHQCMYCGIEYPDTYHGGTRWMAFMESDPLGNASIHQAVGALAEVCFDSYYFDDAGIITAPLNDGNTYDSVVYADDKGFLQSRGIECYLIFSNLATGEPDPVIASTVVNDPGLYIPLMISATTAGGWDGLMFDIEAIPESDRAASTIFIKQLMADLVAVGKKLSLAVPLRTGTAYDDGSEDWFGWCDHGELIKYCHSMLVESYVETGPGSLPGPHCSTQVFNDAYAYMRRVCDQNYWARIRVGVNAYGHYWQNRNDDDPELCDYNTYHEGIFNTIYGGTKVTKQDGEVTFDDGLGGTGWFSTPETINRAVDMATSQGFGGIGVWKLDDGDKYEFWPTWAVLSRMDNMAFVEERFPSAQSWLPVGRPQFKTALAQSDGGHEYTEAAWSSAPLYEFTIKSRYIVPSGDPMQLKADFEALNNFFICVAQGRANTFRFNYENDNTAIAQVLGTGDAVRATYQITKLYQSGARTFTRVIKKPVPGTVHVYLDGVELLSGWTVDTTTGLISFTTPPGIGVIVSATCGFDYPVRFDFDKFPMTLHQQYGLFGIEDVVMVEIRL